MLSFCQVSYDIYVQDFSLCNLPLAIRKKTSGAQKNETKAL